MAIGSIGAIVGGVASGVGAILGSKSQNKAAQAAADTSLAVAEKNNALAREIYGKNEGYLTPFMQTGTGAGSQINALLGLGGAANAGQAFNLFKNSTGYKFRLGEGMDAINSGYAGAGTLQSGAAMKAINRYGQDYASNEFGNYMSYLGNQQGVGLGAGSALAGVGQNYVNTISQNNNNAGTAVANAQLSRTNPLANAMGTIGGGLFGAFS